MAGRRKPGHEGQNTYVRSQGLDNAAAPCDAGSPSSMTCVSSGDMDPAVVMVPALAMGNHTRWPCCTPSCTQGSFTTITAGSTDARCMRPLHTAAAEARRCWLGRAHLVGDLDVSAHCLGNQAALGLAHILASSLEADALALAHELALAQGGCGAQTHTGSSMREAGKVMQLLEGAGGCARMLRSA